MVGRIVAVLLLLFSGVVAVQLAGCGGARCRGFHVDFFVGLTVRGTLVDSETLEPVTGAWIAARTFADGQELLGVHPEEGASSGSDGSFSLYLFERLDCASGYLEMLLLDVGKATRPDQIEVIVFRNGCEHRSTIDVSAETVSDLGLPDNILELTDPIAVPSRETLSPDDRLVLCDTLETCLVDAHCAEGEYCREATGECAPGWICESDAECDEGEYCREATGECAPVGTCESDAECDEGEYCHGPTGECAPNVSCVSDADCGENEWCYVRVCDGTLFCGVCRPTG